MDNKQRYFFRRHQKLKRRKEIGNLIENGKRFSYKQYRVFYLTTSPEYGVKAAIAVSGKTMRKATRRNRVKRLMREAYRLQLPPLDTHLKNMEKGACLFFLFTAKEPPVFKEVFSDFTFIIQQLIQLCNEKN